MLKQIKVNILLQIIDHQLLFSSQSDLRKIFEHAQPVRVKIFVETRTQ